MDVSLVGIEDVPDGLLSQLSAGFLREWRQGKLRYERKYRRLKAQRLQIRKTNF